MLDAARSLGVDIDSVCGGRGICGRCAVTPAFGSFAKHGITSDAVAPQPRPARSRPPTAPSSGLAADRRLSCTAMLLGDAVVDVPPESQVHRQVVRKDLDARRVRRSTRSSACTPSTSRRRTSPRRPATSAGCSTRSARSGTSTTCAPTSRSSARSSRPSTAGDYRVTVAVHGGRDVIAVWPGFHDRAFGVAIDVGSTTIAGHLVEPDRRLGPRQRRGHEPADPLRRGPDEPGLAT